MAITILSDPTDFYSVPYVPAYAPLVYLVSGSNNAQDNYRYILEIVDAQTSAVLFKAKQFPRPVGDEFAGMMRYDIHKIIENLVSFQLPLLAGTSDKQASNLTFQFLTNPYKSYKVQFGEEYGNPIVEYLNVVDTDVTFAWNSAPDYLDMQGTVYTEFLSEQRVFDGTISGTNKMLTTPSSFKISRESYHYLYYLTNVTGCPTTLFVQYYNDANVGLGNQVITNTNTSVGTYNNRMLYVGVGVPQLSVPIGTYRYTVTPIDLNDDICGQTYEYIIDECVCEYEQFDIYFQNKWGGMDCKTFAKVSTETLKTDKSMYNKYDSGNLTSGNKWSGYASDRGRSIFNVEKTKSFRVNSDWLTDAEFSWLQELIESPNVYVLRTINTKKYFIPVILKNADYEVYKNVNGEPKNLIIDFEYAFNENASRG